MEQSDHAGSGSPAPQVRADDGEPTAHHGPHQSSTPHDPSSDLNPKQLLVLEQLLAGASVTKAAGVDRTTVHRWLREDWAFQTAHHRAQRDLRRAVEARLPHLVEAAVETVQAAVRDGDVRAARARAHQDRVGSRPRHAPLRAARFRSCATRSAQVVEPHVGRLGDLVHRGGPGRPGANATARAEGRRNRESASAAHRGLPRFRHETRRCRTDEGTKHSFAIEPLDWTGNERAVQEYLGDRDIRSTRRYARCGRRGWQRQCGYEWCNDAQGSRLSAQQRPRGRLISEPSRVPVESDNYAGLTASKGHLLYVRGGPFYYGREADIRPSLRIFSMEDREEKTLAEEIGGYALSADGTKVLVAEGPAYKLYDAKPEGASSAKTVSTSGLMVDRIPAEEWKQIFDEVWRRFRDFFYVDNMHGYDWEALGEQYRPLLKHVAHRSDLNYLIGEMIAELSAGHTYIAGGDYEVPERPGVALPGAEFELDGISGRYRFARVLRGQNEESIYRAPLAEIGVEVAEGDYLLAIDGVEINGGDNPYRLLMHKADRPVEFTVNGEPTMEGARKVSFEPITSEANLRYLDWVEGNRRKVDEMTGGRVGYLHVPDMGSSGIREFIKWFYPQIRKEGLIVDVRGNGGGNVSQMLIERLRRGLLGTRFARTNDTPGTYPAQVFYGHMVCLLDEDSASDGDIFPHYFREAGIGPLIGKRSWGGVVGITNRGTLIDGGTVFVPEFGTNRKDGSWVIEGYGVPPDIEVENDPKLVLQGRDPQLERGVEEVLKAMEAEPRSLPERPAPPIKTK